MKITVVTDTRACIFAGKEPMPPQVLELSVAILTQAQREILSNPGYVMTKHLLPGTIATVPVVTHYGEPSFPALIEATPEAVLAALGAWIQSLAEIRANVKAKAAADAVVAAEKGAQYQVLREQVSAEFLADLTRRLDISDEVWDRAKQRSVRLLPEAIEEGRRRREADQAASALAEKAAQESLRVWALANGSETLQARIDEGFSWVKLARSEFVRQAATTLGFTEQEYRRGSDDNRTAPNLDEIKSLRDVQKICEATNGVLRNPRIRYVTQEHEHDEDCDSDCDAVTLHWSSLYLDIVAPDNYMVTVARKLADLE